VDPVIYTFTGRKLNPLRLEPGDVVIEDVAHALALCNRFAGHTREPISVAQHSVYAAEIVKGHRYRDAGRTQLQALLHDAAEAYLGDVTKWLKGSPEMAYYRACEEAVQAAVYRAFGRATEDAEPVRAADRLLVRYEGRKGFGDHWRVLGMNPEAGSRYADLRPEEVLVLDTYFGGWRFWSWQEAEARFLETFHGLYTEGR
jgi:hypothetical protein